jgi:hypothetical protein
VTVVTQYPLTPFECACLRFIEIRKELEKTKFGRFDKALVSRMIILQNQEWRGERHAGL